LVSNCQNIFFVSYFSSPYFPNHSPFFYHNYVVLYPTTISYTYLLNLFSYFPAFPMLICYILQFQSLSLWTSVKFSDHSPKKPEFCSHRILEKRQIRIPVVSYLFEYLVYYWIVDLVTEPKKRIWPKCPRQNSEASY
jgi:hypothetical protein